MDVGDCLKWSGHVQERRHEVERGNTVQVWINSVPKTSMENVMKINDI